MEVKRPRICEVVGLAGIFAALVFGYALYHELYVIASRFPFAQETILVFLGAVATIFLTALLLERQTELELSKDARVHLFDQKNSVYMAAIEKVAESAAKRDPDPALIDELRVIGHKLAVIASPEVIKSFSSVLGRLLRGLNDGNLTNADAEEVMHAVAELTLGMRCDMLDEIGSAKNDTAQELIRRNSRQMERLDDLDEA
ncbi:hypothetical protein [Sphingobium sp. YG1]|uniref:hypothetical protein n=1 Tax=Sphingobium sp. YG1 TaxID=2082188 RepID=UPI000E707581|nr:hypothetical protein [Sphingobium sp. YG1]